MNWAKRGHIYVADGSLPWAKHYAFPPTPVIRGDVIRLYVAFCDENIVGRVGWVDVAADEPGRVLDVSRMPVLDIGQPGCFDENGVLPTCVLDVDDELWMYYVGYQRGHKVPYYQFEGLAVSPDGGETFERRLRVPVIDRTDAELFHRTSAFVARTSDAFRMWYVGGSTWTSVGSKMLPVYNMRVIESRDGVAWPPEGRVCLDFADDDEHAFGRPWIFGHDGELRMLYSVRTRSKDYRLGYAVSNDGIAWTRRDEEVGIDVSPDGWDSEMIAYASVVTYGGRTYLFYNGNERGKTGFGYAVLESW